MVEGMKTCNIKLRSCVVLNDTKGLTNSDKDIIVASADTEHCYSFDICDEASRLNDVPVCAFRCIQSATSVAVLGFNSTVIVNNVLGCGNETIETEITELLIHRFIFQLNAQRDGLTERNAKYRISFSCFEVIDSRISDLLVDDLCTNKSVKANAVLKARQRVDSSVFIDGLQSIDITTAESAAAVIRSALSGRSYLIAGTGSGAIPARLIGTVGNVFMQFTMYQTTPLPDNTANVVKESIFEVVSLAVSDTLNFKPADGESMVCVKKAEFGDFSLLAGSINSSSGSSSVNECSSKTAAVLNSCLKSLSTLTRVVQALRSNTADRTSQTSSDTTQPQPQQQQQQQQQKHVPYRDCLLTRLLQRSLHGNCYMTMVTLISSRTENVSRVLRFAAEIGGLYNRIHVSVRVLPRSESGTIVIGNELLLLQSQDTPMSDTTGDDRAVVDDEADGPPQADLTDLSALAVSENSSSNSFTSLLDAFQGDMSALSAELSRISADLFAATATAFASPNSRDAAGVVVGTTTAEEVPAITSAAETASGCDCTVTATESQSPTESPTEPSTVMDNSVRVLMPPSGDTTHVLDGVAAAVISSEASPRTLPPLTGSKSVSKIRIEVESNKTQQQVTSEHSAPYSVSSGVAATGSAIITESADAVLRNKARKSAKVTTSKSLLPVQHKSSSGSTKLSKLTSSTSSSTLQLSSTPDNTAVKPDSARSSSGSNSNPISGAIPTRRKPTAINSSSGVPSLPTLANSSSSGKLPAPSSVSTTGSLLPATPTVLTESRKTIIELGIFESSGGEAALEATDDDSAAVETQMKALPVPETMATSAYLLSAKLPPLKAVHAVLVPPVVQLLTASDVKRVVHSDTRSSGDVGAIINSELSATDSMFDGGTMDTTESAASTCTTADTIVRARTQKPLTFLIDDDNDGDSDGDNRGNHSNSESRHSNTQITSASAASVPPTSLTPVVAPKNTEKEWSFVPRRRATMVENEDDSGGDDLSEPERRFLRACAAGQVQAAENCLLRLGVNVHVKNNFERDAMQICARNGSVPMLTMLLSHGGLLSSRGPRGDTLLHLAAYNGHVDTLKWLHGRGIPPEAVDLLGQTAVHVAARRGELSVLKYLHDELELDFGQLDFEGRLPIECVPRRGPVELENVRQYLTSLEVRDALLRKGAVTSAV